ncbi:MAG: ABC transporter ATP-binding protein [Anaerocolumna sp.]
MKEYKWILRFFLKQQPLYMIMILFLYILMYLLQPLELILLQTIIKSLSESVTSYFMLGIIVVYIIVYSLKNIQFSFSLLIIEILEYKITTILQGKLFNSIATTELVNLDSADYLLKVERAKDTLWYKLTNVVNDSFHFVGALIGLALTGVIIFKASPLYLVLFIIMGILQNVFTHKNTKENISLLKSQEEKNRKLKYYNNLVMDRTKIKEIKSYKIFSWIEEKRLEQFDQVKREHLKFSMKWIRINILWASLMLFFENSILMFICYQVITTAIRLDQMILLTQSQGQIVNGIDNIASFFSDMKKNAIYISEFKSLIEEKKRESTTHKETGDILQFKDVSFCYKGDHYALKHINFKLNRGEIVALVGENGSGKSTLSKIAAGLIQPSKGTISNEYANISAAFQDYSKFEFSLQENVGIGDVSEINNCEKIKKAMKMGQSYDLIEQFPFGLNTMLGKKFDNDGVDISEGQWQKVAISRSLVKNFDLIIFDEPAAALDPIAEKQQFIKMKEYLKGKSVILVSHRIGIVKLADRILYMENGQILEEGTHDQLIHINGKYKRFYLSQAKWYECEGELYEAK